MTDDTSPAEEWRPIPNHPDYEVSSLGRVRSWKGRARQLNKPRMMSPHIHPLGYIRLNIDGRQTSVHQLVAAAWHGPCPVDMEVDHINGVRDDNRPENLRYLTRQENMARIDFRQKSHCKYRHPLTEDNVYIAPKTGARNCKACAARRAAAIRNDTSVPCSASPCARSATCAKRSGRPVCEMHYQRERKAAKVAARHSRRLSA